MDIKYQHVQLYNNIAFERRCLDVHCEVCLFSSLMSFTVSKLQYLKKEFEIFSRLLTY